ncbi:MAG: MerR family transcriptional regulator, thiopeptide resistance regulator [Pseudonocardiales bacterium]|nr:MerR family transcriptional regulator, thiopeptide resistance regulator [Pseudonocardiales bacterium]
MTGYSVGEVARLSHVTVRTLHHYDEIGLLTPSGRTSARYRLYSDADLERLQQILFYRALEFGLDDIAELLSAPDTTAEDHLRRQHRMLRDQITHRHDLLAAIEKEMEAREMGISLTPEEQFEVFGGNYDPQWEQEAEQRWGDTTAWRQSQTRTAAMTKQDWVEVRAEQDEVEAAFAEAMRAGEPVDGARARVLAEAHRASVSRFWDCSHAAHRNLAEMYLADPRFTQHYEDVAPGLAQYVHDAILANSDYRSSAKE